MSDATLADRAGSGEGIVEIAERVRTFLSREVLVLQSCAAVDEGASLIKSGLLDSVDQIKLVAFLEQSFGITIEAEDLEAGHLETIAAIRDFVRSRQSSHDG